MAKYHLNSDKTWHQTEQELGTAFRSWGVARWTVEPNTTPGRVNQSHAHRAENAQLTTTVLERRSRAASSFKMGSSGAGTVSDGLLTL